MRGDEERQAEEARAAASEEFLRSTQEMREDAAADAVAADAVAAQADAAAREAALAGLRGFAHDEGFAALAREILFPDGRPLVPGGEMLERPTSGVKWIAWCPRHGLHGERDKCFVCEGEVEQTPMVPVDVQMPVEDLRRLISELHDEVDNTGPGRYARLFAEARDALLMLAVAYLTPPGVREQ